MIALEPDQRNHCLIRLLYIARLSVSEACCLQWASCTPRKHGGQLTIIGKGQKERTIVLKPDMWNELMALTEREIPHDNQREAALQAYISEMSEPLLHEN